MLYQCYCKFIVQHSTLLVAAICIKQTNFMYLLIKMVNFIHIERLSSHKELNVKAINLHLSFENTMACSNLSYFLFVSVYNHFCLFVTTIVKLYKIYCFSVNFIICFLLFYSRKMIKKMDIIG